ncbi:hypothetical protein REPUB_Repub04eG0196900 [Reevesia pubescens]
MGRGRGFDTRKMYSVVEEYKISHVALAPPLIVTMVRNAEIISGYDLSSLEVIVCEKAHLTKIFGAMGPDESRIEGATGKLMANCEAKIVDPEIGVALPHCKPEKLWVIGALVMNGYVDNEEAIACDFGFRWMVAPAELEHLLISHPDVIEAIVVLFSDEEVGQVPVAFVVRESDSNINESKLKDFVGPTKCEREAHAMLLMKTIFFLTL